MKGWGTWITPKPPPVDHAAIVQPTWAQVEVGQVQDSFTSESHLEHQRQCGQGYFPVPTHRPLPSMHCSARYTRTCKVVAP